jgi:hypothetical protein
LQFQAPTSGGCRGLVVFLNHGIECSDRRLSPVRDAATALIA